MHIKSVTYKRVKFYKVCFLKRLGLYIYFFFYYFAMRVTLNNLIPVNYNVRKTPSSE